MSPTRKTWLDRPAHIQRNTLKLCQDVLTVTFDPRFGRSLMGEYYPVGLSSRIVNGKWWSFGNLCNLLVKYVARLGREYWQWCKGFVTTDAIPHLGFASPVEFELFIYLSYSSIYATSLLSVFLLERKVMANFLPIHLIKAEVYWS
jgi:hypothetical protein